MATLSSTFPECTSEDFHAVLAAMARGEPESIGLLVFTADRHKPRWMSQEQWQQFVRWNRGEAVPTDPEIVDALSTPSPLDECEMTRGQAWAYRTIPGCLVGPYNYPAWCGYINDRMDVGL